MRSRRSTAYSFLAVHLHEKAQPSQAADPAIPLCLQITPAARGRCCGAFGDMRRELTDFQIELEKGFTEAFEHLGMPVAGRRIAGTSETYITGGINDPEITFWIYPERAAFQVGQVRQAFVRPDHHSLADLGCQFLQELVKAAQGSGTEPAAGGIHVLSHSRCASAFR